MYLILSFKVINDIFNLTFLLIIKACLFCELSSSNFNYVVQFQEIRAESSGQVRFPVNFGYRELIEAQ